jgi:FkbH-like protein
MTKIMLNDSTVINKPKTHLNCIVSASFVVEPLEQKLDFIIDHLELPLKTEIAPYHQVFQQLLNPHSNTRKNVDGRNIFLIRLDDFIRDIDDEVEKTQKTSSFSDELINAFQQFCQNSIIQSIVAFLPPSPSISANLQTVICSEHQRIYDEIKTQKNLIVVSQQDVESEGFINEAFYDELSEKLGHVPYNELGYSKLALLLSRKLHALQFTAKKVLVLDCDNTIWKGIVGEDGVDGIELTKPYLAIQQFAIDLQQQGILICLASKNTEQDVLEVFEKRSDMLLKLEHIVAYRVNWELKSQNLVSMATELNLGIDSFVFMDDNPVECAQMREVQPAVTTIQITSEQDIESIIEQMWMFDKFNITEEDTKRTQMYKENSERQKLESSATDLGAFLDSLDLHINVSSPDENEWARVAQLTQRTNQFNFTTIRRNEDEVRALAEQSDKFVLKVDVSDKFGDYGLVGDIFTLKNKSVMEVDTFLLSCRVLGRGVEYEMLRAIARLALANDCVQVRLPYTATIKNEPALAFADSVMEAFKVGDESAGYYFISSAELERIVYVPGTEPEAVKRAKEGKSKKTQASLASAKQKQSISERYAFLVGLTSAQQLLTKIRAANKKPRQLTTEMSIAETPDERRMLNIWLNIFEMDEIGLDDDYTELGGTSLMAARLFAEIGREFDKHMRLTVIMDYPTPRKLLEFMKSNSSEQSRQLITLKKGGEDCLFLIHDGDGETLLYMNVANNLPDDITVYGIEPKAQTDIPLAYQSMSAMAKHYQQVIMEQQLKGKVYVGGMCAGGLIAHIVADKLVRAGYDVNNVFLLDSATHDAPKIFGRITSERAGKLKSFLNSEHQQANIFSKYLHIVDVVAKKTFNMLKWETSSRFQKLSRKIRFKILSRVLSSQGKWPNYLKPLTVREIYNSMEESCTLPSSAVKTLLIKATSGQGGDIPFSAVYESEDLGWRQYTKDLTIVETEGGHASMLQEPYAQTLSKILNSEIKK